MASHVHMHGITFTYTITNQDLQDTVFKCAWQNMCKASLSDMQGITFTGYEYIVQGITFTGYECIVQDITFTGYEYIHVVKDITFTGF